MSEFAPPLPPMGGAGTLASALLTLRRAGRGMPSADLRHFRVPPLDAAHVATYRDALGFDGPAVPLTYLYLLAQRSHLALMLDDGFPYPVPGVVHVANDLAWDPGVAGWRADRPGAIEAGVAIEPPTSSGACFLTLHARLLQEDRIVARCGSRYLARRGTRRGAPNTAGPSAPPAGTEVGRYALSADAGRRYAKVSGDANPIHLWPWSARLLGFSRPITHGMHTVARIAAEMERGTGASLRRIDARFVKPVPIPGEVVLYADAGCVQAWSGGVLAAEAACEF